GYGRVGQRVARGLRQAGIPVVVIEQDLQRVRDLNAAGIKAIYGDASSVHVLAAAAPAQARPAVIALPDFGAPRATIPQWRRPTPAAVIVARAQQAENDVKLREAGATAVIVPELAGALMLLEEALLLLQVPHEHVFTGVRQMVEGNDEGNKK